ncbi:uncharacterized protein [Amphiura filiformis]|uniref:uncharacterized protein n=1 Tax=Amphiura filiformis TaxID=82378 RepID=UPI003B225843
MDPLWRALILFLTCIVYLFVGAGIFSVLEGHYEKVTKTDINQTIFDFLSKHKDVEVNELLTVVHKLHDAFHSGVNADEVVEGTYHNRWDVVNAFYFCVTTITTIGFGHLSPSSYAGKIFFILYALIGIPTMAWFLIEVGLLFKKKFKILHQKFQNSLSNHISARLVRLTISIIIAAVLTYIFLIVIPAGIFAHVEGWSHMDAQYFAFSAIFTIGFGDLIPTEHNTGWQEWIYKLGTTFYYFIAMVFLVTIGCVLQDLRSDFNVVSHHRMMMDNNGGQTRMEEQMGADVEEKELALGHLALQTADADTNIDIGVEDNYSDGGGDDEDMGDGKYRRICRIRKTLCKISREGFGHLSPATSAGKVLFGFYAFFGIPLMAWFLIESGTLMKERILLMSQKIQNGLSHCIRANFLRLFITTLIFVLAGYVILLVIPAAIIASIEGWGHADAQYFCFVSLTTIGFGDLIATEHTSGWVEWVYKLATTMYYFNGMVVLTAVACILYEKRPAPKMATHERLMNNGGQVAVEEQMREQMVADPEERELALGHLTLQEAEGHVEVTVEDDYEDDNSDDGGGDGKYRKL